MNFLLFAQDKEIHRRGMLRQTIFANGSIGRPLDSGKGGALLSMPSFEWPSNQGYPIYIRAANETYTFEGFYNSLGGGLWIAADTAVYSGTGATPRLYIPCGALTDASGNNQTTSSIPRNVQRIENYPVLENGEINPSYNPDDAEEIIISEWDTYQGVSVKRTSRAWSFPDYDDFIIYEYEIKNNRSDTLRAVTVAFIYSFTPSMIAGRMYNQNVWADVAFRGDKPQGGSLSMNYARFDWHRYMIYNHSINGIPFFPQDAIDTIMLAPAAIGILPLYYDYDHLANKYQVKVALASGSPASDTINLYDENKKLKQPYTIGWDNGNLNMDKFSRYYDIEVRRNNIQMRSSSDSATFGLYWIGRARPSWGNTLRNPTGKLYGFGPYILPPGEVLRFSYAEMAGFGPGTEQQTRYNDLGGGWGTGDQAPSPEPEPGVHPVPSWWTKLRYDCLNPNMDREPQPGQIDYRYMGSTYMQTRKLPDYVNSPNTVSLKDVADRAIQMYKGGDYVRYDTIQFDPSPLAGALPTGSYKVPIPCPSPAIHVINTPSASNKIIWGAQVESINRSTPGFARLIAPPSYYLVLRSVNPMGPWKILDSVGLRDPRYFVDASSIEKKGNLVLGDSAYVYYDETSKLGQSFFYSVVVVDSLGNWSAKTNIKSHITQTPAVSKLRHVYAAPNPFILNSGAESASGIMGGDVGNIIYFCGLPKRATIRIYSYSGQLVKTLEHESVSANNPDGEFSNYWLQVSRNEQWVSSGVYYFIVEDKDTGDRAWNKFVIIH